MGPSLFFEEDFHPNIPSEKTSRGIARTKKMFDISNMEKESKREKKRDSAKKAREHQVFTQKHVRLQEKNKSSASQDKAKRT